MKHNVNDLIVEKKILIEIFKYFRFLIPEYQRKYSWEKDKEIEYLKDEIHSHKLGYKLLKINYDDLKSKELFKEDFEEWEENDSYDFGNKCDEKGYLYECVDPTTVSYYRLENSKKYDKLPSKEDK